MKYKIKCLDCGNVFWQEEIVIIECENCGGEKGKQGKFKILGTKENGI